MNKCPHCGEIIGVPSAVGVVNVVGVPVLMLSCPYCHTLIGIVRA